MNRSRYTSMLARATADRGMWRIVAVTMAAANLVLAGMVMTKSERTVLLPPAIEKGFWIAGHDASPEYLEQMALWFTQLALTVDASSVQYQGKVLLRYVAPDAHGDIQTRAALYADRIRRDEIAQVFYPGFYKIDAPKMRVALTGTLQRWVGKTLVKPEQRTYRLIFRMDAGRIVVTEFKEADPNEPFNPEKDRGADDVGAVSW